MKQRTDKQRTERLAVLIDAENASAKLIVPLLTEIAKYGVASVKRVYGDWTKAQLNGWKDVLIESALQPIQQFSYTTGKNSTDSSLIIDAMDLLYTKTFEGFCIVSSDSDFTRLACKLLQIPLPTDQQGILNKLVEEGLVVLRPAGRYDITNLGAILFATNLAKFDQLGRKALRIIKYKGGDRTETEREWQDAPSQMGYAVAFEAAVAFTNSQLPQNEPVGEAFSAEVRVYPENLARNRRSQKGDS